MEIVFANLLKTSESSGSLTSDCSESLPRKKYFFKEVFERKIGRQHSFGCCQRKEYFGQTLNREVVGFFLLERGHIGYVRLILVELILCVTCTIALFSVEKQTFLVRT